MRPAAADRMARVLAIKFPLRRRHPLLVHSNFLPEGKRLALTRRRNDRHTFCTEAELSLNLSSGRPPLLRQCFATGVTLPIRSALARVAILPPIRWRVRRRNPVIDSSRRSSAATERPPHEPHPFTHSQTPDHEIDPSTLLAVIGAVSHPWRVSAPFPVNRCKARLGGLCS